MRDVDSPGAQLHDDLHVVAGRGSRCHGPLCVLPVSGLPVHTALLVGGIGVANTMVISVLERRSEIGLRRALGATKGNIRLQFLTEAILLAALGGLAGVALGTIATAV